MGLITQYKQWKWLMQIQDSWEVRNLISYINYYRNTWKASKKNQDYECNNDKVYPPNKMKTLNVKKQERKKIKNMAAFMHDPRDSIILSPRAYNIFVVVVTSYDINTVLLQLLNEEN